jgi:hypothetical protein
LRNISPGRHFSGSTVPLACLVESATGSDDQAMVDRFRRMADATGMPVVIYSREAAE